MDRKGLQIKFKGKGGRNVELIVKPEDTMKCLRLMMKSQVDDGVNVNELLGLEETSSMDNMKVAEFFASQLLPEEPEEAVETEWTLIASDTNSMVDLENGSNDLINEETCRPSAMICAAIGCPHSKFDNPSLLMFPFPIHKELCLHWLEFVDRLDLSQFTPEHLHTTTALCENHFSHIQFLNDEMTQLKEMAKPDLLLPKNIHLKTIKAEKICVNPQEQCDILNEENNAGEFDLDQNNIIVYGFCRLCANPIDSNDVPFFVFKKNRGDIVSVAEQINGSLPLSVETSDILPKQICSYCYDKLQKHYDFTIACVEAEEKLRKMNPTIIVQKSQQIEEDTICENGKATKYCSSLCAKETICNHSEPDTKILEGNNIIILNAENLNSFDETSTSFITLDVNSADSFSGLYSDAEEEETEEIISKLSVNNSKSSNSILKTILEKECTIKSEETDDLKSMVKLMFFQEDLNEMYLECLICDEYFLTAKVCLDHCKTHAALNFYPCIICGIVFESDGALVEHFQFHAAKLNPNWQKISRPVYECVTCKETFTSRKNFMMHKCVQPKINVIKGQRDNPECKLCELHFRSEERNEIHRQFHAEGTKCLLACPLCDLMFELPKMLQYHNELVHQKVPVYECPNCPLKFYCQGRMETHKKVHMSTMFQCSLCNKLFSKLQSINKHMEKHNNDNKLKSLHCFRCNKTFLSRAHYTFHMETEHDSVRRMPSIIQYECKLCIERFTSSQEVMAHRFVHWTAEGSTDFSHICEYCGENFTTTNALTHHRRNVHPNEKPYVCTVCESRSRTLYEARVHRKLHTSQFNENATNNRLPMVKEFECTECPSVFPSRTLLQIHRKTHKGAKLFKCEHCPKTFPERSRLIVHQRLHTGEKPFSCGVCGKRFPQLSAMYTHALLHTGETPHSCDICGRKFRIKSDRDAHYRTHTGEKPYKCPYCPKTFRVGQVYYQHKMIHTDERRYVCDICKKAFKRSHTLACHRRIHTGEKPNICNVCGKGFRQRTDMRKHSLNVHGVRS